MDPKPAFPPVPEFRRSLTQDEIEALARNGNRAEDWSLVEVAAAFDPDLVRNCSFQGRVRIGRLERGFVEGAGPRLPRGFYDSRLADCEVGANAAVHRVGLVSRFRIGDECLLFDVGELSCSERPRFGLGFLFEDENEDRRPVIAVWNEAGGRAVAAFEDMRCADAALWARHRDDAALMRAFRAMTDRSAPARRPGALGEVGARCAILHTRAIRDSRIGAHALVDGADLLHNTTIRSDASEQTRVGSGVELRDGIVGFGCHVEGRSRAERFVLGTRCKLESGARIADVALGDNSTIACCEVLNCLIFPNHEQHHNNSFLIASCLEGQSNIAAGAVIGSNHNSRANDGEILARRGFWPGLCSSFKHDCRFASFTLVAKGDYPAELDISLPFALVSNSDDGKRLQILPAYWFLYNMYALARNAWKFANRDKRIHKARRLEFDPLAPDTVEEILDALGVLEEAVGRALIRLEGGAESERSAEDTRRLGRAAMLENPAAVARLEVRADHFENSRRPVLLLKTERAWEAYRETLEYYAVRVLARHMIDNGVVRFADLVRDLPRRDERVWRNLGGQLAGGASLEAILERARNGEIATWDALHREYERLDAAYPTEKAAHALGVLERLLERSRETLCENSEWPGLLDRAEAILERRTSDIHSSRAKDYANPFKRMSFANEAEQKAVLGALEDNSFALMAEEDFVAFRKTVAELKGREAGK